MTDYLEITKVVRQQFNADVPAELEAALAVYRQFFDGKAVRDGRLEPRGISYKAMLDGSNHVPL